MYKLLIFIPLLYPALMLVWMLLNMLLAKDHGLEGIVDWFIFSMTVVAAIIGVAFTWFLWSL